MTATTVSRGAFLDAAGKWLRDQECEIVSIEESASKRDVTTWGETLLTLGADSIGLAINPATPSLRMVRTAFRHGNRIQLNFAALDIALAPYADSSSVVGVKLGRLSQGNTRVMPIVVADNLTVAGVRDLCARWVQAAVAFQKIGRAPGQTLGELTVGFYTLGLQGFRIEQPAEVYPIFVYFDERKFASAIDDLLLHCVWEIEHKRDSLGGFVLPKAPVFLQALFVSVPARKVVTHEGARESRRAWRHYKKPKLAKRVMTTLELQKILRGIPQH